MTAVNMLLGDVQLIVFNRTVHYRVVSGHPHTEDSKGRFTCARWFDEAGRESNLWSPKRPWGSATSTCGTKSPGADRPYRSCW